MKTVPIKVESHSGYKADEYPKSFYWHNKKFEIKEITDRWYEGYPNAERPAVNYYKVCTNTDMLCIIKHDIEMDLWYLVKIW